MSRKDSIDNLFMKKPIVTASSPARSPDRVRTGAISAMGSSLHEMAENAKQVTKLQQQLAEGEPVVSLDPSAIDRSKIADRIQLEIDPDFEALVASIGEHGQQVPILVRPHPETAGRFQIAYGRRRLRAAEQLGRPVRAIVKSLSDSELYIAQGRENLDRKDLSFIEKAFFARNLEDGGCDRATIISALVTDKADVSRYIAVARRLPDSVVNLIGPAPKAGRARWMALAEHLANPSMAERADQLLRSYVEQRLDSDARLSGLLGELSGRVKASTKRSKSTDVWRTPTGTRAVVIEAKQGKTSIVFEEKTVPAFAQFVSARLDELYEEFQTQNGKGD
ncbi:plasmid partitioning protein RepB [Rhizobium sp. RU36D]|uniref:plasmid partitioning protein RepB n=1 Tax=Rhizobium sp. RU36D TaxID=1907415 RepID=UPI0009D9035B|nr:plasmid partitioning protein RepB [Rhizobium sp. RU36D]SMD12910.1 ParB family protein [Rhizobium sp. RU36D]